MLKTPSRVSAGVPTIWMGILNALDKEPGRWQLADDLSMIVGGSAAPESMIRRFDGHGLQLIQAWGMTETSPLGTSGRLKPAVQALDEDARYARRATVGTTVPLVRVRIVDNEGELARRDGQSMGELQIRGPWVAGNYYRLENSEEKFTADGWLRTGDIATIDAEGFGAIVGRIKDMVIRGGENVYPREIEEYLYGHPSIEDVQVIGVPDERFGEQLCACIKLRDGASVTTEQIQEFCEGQIAHFKIPHYVRIVDSFPMTVTGKIQKFKMREISIEEMGLKQ